MTDDWLEIAKRDHEVGEPPELITAGALIAIAEELRKINDQLAPKQFTITITAPPGPDAASKVNKAIDKALFRGEPR